MSMMFTMVSAIQVYTPPRVVGRKLVYQQRNTTEQVIWST